MKNLDYKKISKKIVFLKLEIGRLMSRLEEKRSEYLTIFALKRTRKAFELAFESRAKNLTYDFFEDLSEEILVAYEHFFFEIDDLYWYLMFTEDMPGLVEINLDKHLKSLKRCFDIFSLYVDSEMSRFRPLSK